MKRNKMQHNQSGFVAIFSVLIIMGILTLLTIGFSAATRQAQVRTLNDHLHNQAFYAAESGVNMATTALSNGNVSQKNECRNGGTFNYNVDSTNNIAVSCLLINGNPSNLEFSNIPIVGDGEPVVSRLTRATGANTISYVRIDWDSASSGTGIQNRPNGFPPYSGWGNNVGVLRVDLVPANSTNRDTVVNGAYSFYLYPTDSAGSTSASVSGGYGGQGTIVVTRCNPAAVEYRCSSTITLNGSASSGYYIRLGAYYQEGRARVTALEGSTPGSSEILLRDGQAVVDSTGQANDVYRRIQVRVPLTPSAGFNTGLHEVFSVFSGNSICKRYVGIPGGSISSPPSGVTDDPACDF